MIFSALRPAVEQVLQSFDVQPTADFSQLVRDEFAKIAPTLPVRPPEKNRLNTLYELRSRYLDWELGTGYLGFFSANAGTRYTFTRRMEAVYQMLPFPLSSRKQWENLRVLEIGCGAGLFCLELAQLAKMVVGLDISHFALDFANKLQEYLKCENLSFQHGDAETLMFHDRVFDLVICSEVLEHLLAPEKALAEIRRVVKETGLVIVTTPCAVSLSDITMDILRIFNRQLEAEKSVHFDKKTFLALQRLASRNLPGVSKTPRDLETGAFMRIHERFRYQTLIRMFQKAGFDIDCARGAVFAFPPHYQVFYRYVPAVLLPLVRLLEDGFNRMHLFQRWGSVTTCFQLTPQRRRR